MPFAPPSSSGSPHIKTTTLCQENTAELSSLYQHRITFQILLLRTQAKVLPYSELYIYLIMQPQGRTPETENPEISGVFHSFNFDPMWREDILFLFPPSVTQLFELK